ncbi:1-phosphofructokinase [Pleomorphochaeta sp. DL1XJH-081]|uniref:1-phosphofructokinase n=1 Tax=Pleomorphochaeta sp. DL1XJH-081 TaxID=3409690 RepID=UPI003BB50461
MIYTITLNPALDYIVHVDDLLIGKINCNESEDLRAGGKGINVSTMLHTLGIKNIAIATVAGETGKFIERMVEDRGVETRFIYLNEGYTRINVKITAKESTAFNGIGPSIDTTIISEIMDRIGTLSPSDYVVIAGSLPKTAPRTLYSELVSTLEEHGVEIIIDTAGRLLKDLLVYNPLLIKPNTEELSEYFGKVVNDTEDIIRCAKLLQTAGARNVLVSQGSDGSILLDENKRVFIGNSPGGPVVNTVGCGDSMVAGFIAGYLQHKDSLEAYKFAIAASTAKAVCATEISSQFVQEMANHVLITGFDAT